MLVHDYKPPPVIIEPSKYRLRIQMVPEKASGHNLRGLIPSTQWDRIKNAAFAVAGHRCEACGGVGSSHPVECHELWDFNQKLRLQKLNGLQVLCPDCHGAAHIGFSKKSKSPQTYERIRGKLMSVNGLTGDQVDKYIRMAFASHNETRDMLWVMDLSWLSKNFIFSWSKKALGSSMLIRGSA